MNDRFVVDPDAQVSGTYLVGQIRTSYNELVNVLGPSSSGDDYKVSSEWILFDSLTGNVFAIYDWKETNLYSDSLPSVEDFRNGGRTTWHIGGKSNPSDFINWLTSKLYGVH